MGALKHFRGEFEAKVTNRPVVQTSNVELPIHNLRVNSCKWSISSFLPSPASSALSALTAHGKPADTIDLPMDADTIMKAGSRLGTCLLMVVDETQCISYLRLLQVL
jgi:hypothetical protein